MHLYVRYRARNRIRPKEVERIDLGPYRHGTSRAHRSEELLFDTAEHHLARTGYVLRARREGNEGVLVLERPADAVDGEGCVVDTAVVDPEDAGAPSSWPAAFQNRLRSFVGASRLRQLARVRDRRQSWDLYRGDRVIGELALHRARIQHAGVPEPLREIEIALRDGSDKDLSRLACLVTSALRLESEPSNGVERALLVWADRGETLSAAARHVPMRSIAPLAEAMRSALAEQLRELHTALPIARAGRDPEGVHDARVAIRRLRAILELCESAGYRRSVVRRLRRRLSRLARALGRVRDADVSLSRARRDDVRRVHEQDRRVARRGLHEVLRQRRTVRLFSRLRRLVTTPGAGLRQKDLLGDTELVRDAAGRLLWGRYERLRRFESRLCGAPLATLHALRIEVKRLRYALELFGPALAVSASDLVRPLVAAQDHLGELHDLAVEAEYERGRHDASRDQKGELAERIAELHEGAPSAVAPMLDADYRARLGAAIAGM